MPNTFFRGFFCDECEQPIRDEKNAGKFKEKNGTVKIMCGKCLDEIEEIENMIEDINYFGPRIN